MICGVQLSEFRLWAGHTPAGQAELVGMGSSFGMPGRQCALRAGPQW